MKLSRVSLSLLFIVSLFSLSLTFSSNACAAEGKRAMVATADPRATAAALEILKKGGSAVDAAVAAQWVLNVVEPQSSGIGGGGFFLYYEARTRRLYAFDGRETAPGEAFPEMFLNERGKPYPFKPDRITGGLPVGVPGVLRLLHKVHSRFGTEANSFSALFQPAIQIAERGFSVSDRLAYFIDKEKERLRMFPESRRIYFDEKQRPLGAGDILFQYGLARTFRKIQEKGIDVFYEGEIAKAIVQAVRGAPFHPGFMRESDLKQYVVKERAVLHGNYRGYDIYTMGPPTSGGTTLLEALNILENYDLTYYGGKPERYHLMAEALYLAFEDRNRYLGDPDFGYIPVEKIISKVFAKERSQPVQFEFSLASPTAQFRTTAADGLHTSHISIVDGAGNMVSFTTTIEDVFGSAMAVPEWGFLLNNELTDFEAEPWVKVPGNKKPVLHPNAPEGDKRPRSSMTPVFVFNQGRPVLIAGSPGGSTIIATVLNILVNVIDFRMGLLEALRAPKLLKSSESLEMEPPLYRNADLRKALEKMKHKVIERAFFGNAQAILFEDNRGAIIGESDPRGEGKSQGF